MWLRGRCYCATVSKIAPLAAELAAAAHFLAITQSCLWYQMPCGNLYHKQLAGYQYYLFESRECHCVIQPCVCHSGILLKLQHLVLDIRQLYRMFDTITCLIVLV